MVLAPLLACAHASDPDPGLPTAQVAFVGGTVRLGTTLSSTVSGLAVSGGRIVGFEAGDAVPRIDLGGGTVIPAFRAEADWSAEARAQTALDLGDLVTKQAVLDRVGRARSEDWVVGRGWDARRWSDGAPRAGDLERAAPGRRIALRRADGRGWWLSTSAAEALGLVPQASPVWTGSDAARIESRLPAPSPVLPALLAAQRALLSRGIVQVDAIPRPAVREGLRSLDRSGQLVIEVRAWIDATAPTVGIHGPPFRGRRLSVDGVHVAFDPSRAAWLQARLQTAHREGYRLSVQAPDLRTAMGPLAQACRSCRIRVVGPWSESLRSWRPPADPQFLVVWSTEPPNPPWTTLLAEGWDYGYGEAQPLRGAHRSVHGAAPAEDPTGPETERLSPATALSLALRREGQLAASLGLGSTATFVVLDEDPLTVPPHRLGLIQVRATVVEGRVVYARSASGDVTP
jgi:predicted amidohydrolase YtcJ